MHILHKWSKWSDPIPTYDTGRKQQWRICTTCNKADFITLPWDKQVDLRCITEAITRVKEVKAQAILKEIGEE